MIRTYVCWLTGLSALLLANLPVRAADATTAFTVQGQLKQDGNNVNATAQFRYQLWDAASGGNAVSSAQTATGVVVQDGIFSNIVDFGEGAFNQNAVWMSVEVKLPGDPDFVMMSARQQVTNVPMSTTSRGLRDTFEAPETGEAIFRGPSPSNELMSMQFNGTNFSMETSQDAGATSMSMRAGASDGSYTDIVLNNAAGTVVIEDLVASSNAANAINIFQLKFNARTNPGISSSSNLGSASISMSALGTGSENTSISANHANRSIELSSAGAASQAAGGRAAGLHPQSQSGSDDAQAVAGGYTPTIRVTFDDLAHAVNMSAIDLTNSQTTSINMVSASPDGSSTNMSVNNVSRSMTISGQSAASNTAAAAQLGSLTFDLSNPSAVQMSMFSGLSPAALHINAGPNPGMEISPNGNAIFRGPGGVTASTVNISSAFAAAREGSVAGSASAQISINGTTGNVEMKVGDEIVDRWTPVGITENGQAPNRIGGSIYNGVASGKFGATIGGGGSTPIPDGCDSDCTSVNPPDPPTCLNDCTVTHGNFVGDTWGTVGGGVLNRAEGGQSTVGGGGHNWAKNHYSTIAGGTTNLVEHPAPSPYSFGAIGGGYVNTVHGQAGTVPGGFNNTAGGLGSFAAGCGAKARGGEPGVFVWADAQGMPEDLAIEVPMSNQIYSTAPNQFIARSEGGFWFGKQIFTHTNIREDARFATDTYLQTTAGVSLTLESCLNDCLDGTPPPPYDVPPDPEGCARNCYAPAARLTNGGTWTNASDRNNKENITAVDAREVLEKVATMPIARWNYKIESDSTQHIGPMAQDFHAAFGLGDSEKSIATIDADGVALAAIQGLNEIVKEKDCRISELEERLAKLEALIQARETDSKDEGR